MRSSYSRTRGVNHSHPVRKTLLSALFPVVVIMSATSAARAAEGDLVWVKRAGGPRTEIGYSIATLPDGSALLTGAFRGPTTFGAGEPNETILISEGEHADAFVAKYTSYGTLAWAKRITGELEETGTGIAALRDGGAAVTGYFKGAATLGEGEPNETTLTSVGGFDIYVARYSPDGRLAWAKHAGGIVDDLTEGVAPLLDGSVLVTGRYEDNATFGPDEPNETVLSSEGVHNPIFVAKYNLDGTLAWAKGAGGTYSWDAFGDRGELIAALSDGSALVTGNFGGTWTFGAGESNETTLTSAGATDIFVAKYNPDGRLAWVARAGGTQRDRGQAIATLPDGSAVVTGEFKEDATFGSGEPTESTLTSAGYDDIFVAKYNPDGTVAWARRAGGAYGPLGGDVGQAIATLPDGGALVTGFFQATATFGPGEPNETTLTSGGQRDVFVARYNPDGTLVWAERAGGTASDRATGIASLGDGGVLVTGDFGYMQVPGYTATFGPGEPNETTLTSAGYEDIFLARFEGWRAPDLDGDGLPDAVESDTGTYNGPSDTGTDPHNPDTDGDGLIDGDEVHDLDPDTPGDQNPFHPLDPNSTGDNFQDTPDGVPDGENDYDGDGQSNAYELRYGSNPLDPTVVVPGVTYVGGAVLVVLLIFCGLCYLNRRRLIGS